MLTGSDPHVAADSGGLFNLATEAVSVASLVKHELCEEIGGLRRSEDKMKEGRQVQGQDQADEWTRTTRVISSTG